MELNLIQIMYIHYIVCPVHHFFFTLLDMKTGAITKTDSGSGLFCITAVGTIDLIQTNHVDIIH